MIFVDEYPDSSEFGATTRFASDGCRSVCSTKSSRVKAFAWLRSSRVGQLALRPLGDVDRFDIVGAGKPWGNKMNYTRREMSIASVGQAPPDAKYLDAVSDRCLSNGEELTSSI